LGFLINSEGIARASPGRVLRPAIAPAMADTEKSSPSLDEGSKTVS